MTLVGYSDVGYMTDRHITKSLTGYIFLCSGTVISWCSIKQTVLTS